MTFLLYGEDTYRLKERFAELTERFFKKTGSDFNFVELDGAAFEFNDLVSAVGSVGLLSALRLVVVNDFLLSARGAGIEKDVLKLLDEIPKETVLVFREGGAPKTGALLKALEKKPHSERFDPLKGVELVEWIIGYIESREGKIQRKDAELIASETGNDLWFVSNELSKLLSYNNEISQESIELLLTRNISPSIFDLLNAIARRDRSASLGALHQLLSNGESEMAILGMITKQVRDTALVKSFSHDQGDYEISLKTKIHPFAIGKARALAQVLSEPEISSIFSKLEETDRAIRQGEMAPVLALDLLVSDL